MTPTKIVLFYSASLWIKYGAPSVEIFAMPRPAGALNKRAQALWERAEAEELEPAPLLMLRWANGRDVPADWTHRDRLVAAREAAPYFSSKLKLVEMPDDPTRAPQMVMADVAAVLAEAQRRGLNLLPDSAVIKDVPAPGTQLVRELNESVFKQDSQRAQCPSAESTRNKPVDAADSNGLNQRRELL